MASKINVLMVGAGEYNCGFVPSSKVGAGENGAMVDEMLSLRAGTCGTCCIRWSVCGTGLMIFMYSMTT